MSDQVHTVVMKINMDCLGCCQKVRKALLKIDDQKQNIVTVSGPFDPQKVVKRIAKKTGKRIQVLETISSVSKASEGPSLNAVKSSTSPPKLSVSPAIVQGGESSTGSSAPIQEETSHTCHVVSSNFFSEEDLHCNLL